jgi:hypothetical protein
LLLEAPLPDEPVSDAPLPEEPLLDDPLPEPLFEAPPPDDPPVPSELPEESLLDDPLPEPLFEAPPLDDPPVPSELPEEPPLDGLPVDEPLDLSVDELRPDEEAPPDELLSLLEEAPLVEEPFPLPAASTPSALAVLSSSRPVACIPLSF